jgi:hypothetical protein
MKHYIALLSLIAILFTAAMASSATCDQTFIRKTAERSKFDAAENLDRQIRTILENMHSFHPSKEELKIKDYSSLGKLFTPFYRAQAFRAEELLRFYEEVSEDPEKIKKLFDKFKHLEDEMGAYGFRTEKIEWLENSPLKDDPRVKKKPRSRKMRSSIFGSQAVGAPDVYFLRFPKP